MRIARRCPAQARSPGSNPSTVLRPSLSLPGRPPPSSAVVRPAREREPGREGERRPPSRLAVRRQIRPPSARLLVLDELVGGLLLPGAQLLDPTGPPLCHAPRRGAHREEGMEQREVPERGICEREREREGELRERRRFSVGAESVA
uniref:Uncharacterized protein n=1 Tax=Arundo donax TaxID=35708 RepID=A0A0A9GIC3_ARUDO